MVLQKFLHLRHGLLQFSTHFALLQAGDVQHHKATDKQQGQRKNPPVKQRDSLGNRHVLNSLQPLLILP